MNLGKGHGDPSCTESVIVLGTLSSSPPFLIRLVVVSPLMPLSCPVCSLGACKSLFSAHVRRPAIRSSAVSMQTLCGCLSGLSCFFPGNCKSQTKGFNHCNRQGSRPSALKLSVRLCHASLCYVNVFMTYLHIVWLLHPRTGRVQQVLPSRCARTEDEHTALAICANAASSVLISESLHGDIVRACGVCPLFESNSNSPQR